MYRRSIMVFRLDMDVISSINMFESRITSVRKSVLEYAFITSQGSDLCARQHRIPCIRPFSVGVQAQHLCTASSSPETLLKKLHSALRKSKDEEAWKVFNEYKSCYGFPGSSTIRHVKRQKVSELHMWQSNPWQSCNVSSRQFHGSSQALYACCSDLSIFDSRDANSSVTDPVVVWAANGDHPFDEDAILDFTHTFSQNKDEFIHPKIVKFV